MSSAESFEPRMWAHGYVRCENCRYDSHKANEVHVYEVGRESLECPMCRSLDCHEINVDGEPEVAPNVLEFEIPDGMTVMSAVAVADVSDNEGEPIVLLLSSEDVRKVQTLGLLSYAQEMVKERMAQEWEGEG